MEVDKNESHFACKLNLLTRPDGSVILSEGNTTVIAGIYGPVEVKLQRLLIEKASVECHYRPKSGLPKIEDRLYESIIRNVCETSLLATLYPRTAVLLTIQELQNSGQLISCAINAACLACLNAGIDMKFMFGAVTCYLSQDDEITMDSIPEKNIKGLFVFVFDSIEYRVIASHTKGSYKQEHYEEALELSRSNCSEVFEYFKTVFLKQ